MIRIITGGLFSGTREWIQSELKGEIFDEHKYGRAFYLVPEQQVLSSERDLCELLPADESGKIQQKTEDLVGPYELHDFFLYYMLRFGFPPAKLLRLAEYAYGSAYERKEIIKWLRVFMRRFFTQQFKRSCLPDGPKVGSVAVSPRGDLRMPSDASAALWLRETEGWKEDG